ncbi:MAG: hypothetical protein P1U30_02180, partial [Phycisphaerales bacterium]|nr:hypothetical protein [Phycisphaerales bacterium]
GLMSVSGVKLLPYVMATAIGMAPRTFAAVWIGNQITSWDEYNKPKWLVIAGIVLMVVVIMILGQMANKAIDKAMGTNPAASPSTSTDDTQPDSTSNPAE